MRYAITAGKKRVEAARRIETECFCQLCNNPVIAKCGVIRIWHWAHKSGQACDGWQSPMTEWHRAWQDKFPEECREVALVKANERHIADVLVPVRDKETRLVIEFQHSSLDSEERSARERFYGKMVWVVDGNRTKSATDHVKGINECLRPIGQSGFYRARIAENYLPPFWLGSNVPVFFDFNEFPLFCVFPVKIGQEILLKPFSREIFITMANTGTLRNWLLEQLKVLKTFKAEWISDQERKRKSVAPINASAFQRHHEKKAARRRGPRFS
ncbi:MAG: competence protein CoiA [Desulfovibrio sp.]